MHVLSVIVSEFQIYLHTFHVLCAAISRNAFNTQQGETIALVEEIQQ